MFIECDKPLATGQYEDGIFLMKDFLGDKRTGINVAKGAVVDTHHAKVHAKEFGIPLAVTPVVLLSTQATLQCKRLGYIHCKCT